MRKPSQLQALPYRQPEGLRALGPERAGAPRLL